MSRRRIRPWALSRWDVGVPAIVAALGLVELAVVRPGGWPAALVLELAACAVLVFRRRTALVAAPLAAVGLLTLPWFGPQLSDLSVPLTIVVVALFALGRWPATLVGLVGVGLIAAMLTLDYLFVDRRAHDITDVAFIAVVLAGPYVLGRVVRRLDQQRRLVEERAEAMRREAVAQERTRIARDLHDVLAHSISLMVVQASAAREVVGADPERADRMLLTVADTGRAALDETGRLLHRIRGTEDAAVLAPTPGLAGLAGLVAEYRERGLPVRFELDEVPELPAGADVSAYRIVQEMLTNALRHRHGEEPTRLSVGIRGGRLRIEASNPSRGPAGGTDRLGLVGMTERVAQLDGTLRHTDVGGRFTITAEIPVPS